METIVMDNLVGSGQVRTFSRTLASGSSVDRGTVLGFLTATEKVTLYDSGGAGGEQTVYGIAAEAVNAATSDKPITVYVAGDFNYNALIFEGGINSELSFINEARALGMYVTKFTGA
jgi:hypothetical protein